MKENALNSLSTRDKKLLAEFANSVDLDEVAHNGPPHLDLYCLPYSQYDRAWTEHFLKIADENFVICFLVVKELSKYAIL